MNYLKLLKDVYAIVSNAHFTWSTIIRGDLLSIEQKWTKYILIFKTNVQIVLLIQNIKTYLTI